MSINKGEPINPKKLENIIIEKFDSIFTSLTGLIPIGFNSLYNITAAKTFNLRPKVINPIYSTRSGSDVNAINADTTQPNIGAAFLGTPWTLTLGYSFGLGSYANINKGLTSEPYAKISPKVPFNPATDLYGGVPLRGNAPLLFRGYVGLSNWFEDANIRASIDQSGGTLSIKAKQLSMFYPYRESDSQDDYAETAYKQGIALSKPISDINLLVDSTGLTEGDYLVYITGTGSTDNITFTQSDLAVRFKDATDLSTDYGITWSGEEAGSANLSYHRYERPLFLVHSNGTGIESSNVTAWEEVVGTNTNADPKYTKQYQQCTSTDTSTTLQTLDNDRRMIPAYHYFNNNSNQLIDTVCYNGIAKDILGAGGNKVIINAPVWASNDPQMDIYVDQCELTNGTSSLWVKNLSLGADDIFYSNGSPLDPYQKRGLYIWLLAKVKDAKYAASGTNISNVEGYSLDYKIALHSSPTWNPDSIGNNSGSHQQTGFWYTTEDPYRCRIGWIPTDPNNTAITTKIVDGHHTFPSVNRFTGGANNALPNLSVGTGTTTAGLFEPVSLNTCKTLPIWGNNGLAAITTSTAVACTSIDLELYNVSGTSTTGTNWVGVTTDTIATAAGIDIQTTGSLDQLSGSPWLGVDHSTGTKAHLYSTQHTLSIGTNDNLYYAGTGADGGAYWSKTFKMALVKGFFLPYSYE